MFICPIKKAIIKIKGHVDIKIKSGQTDPLFEWCNKKNLTYKRSGINTYRISGNTAKRHRDNFNTNRVARIALSLLYILSAIGVLAYGEYNESDAGGKYLGMFESVIVVAMLAQSFLDIAFIFSFKYTKTIQKTETVKSYSDFIESYQRFADSTNKYALLDCTDATSSTDPTPNAEIQDYLCTKMISGHSKNNYDLSFQRTGRHCWKLLKAHRNERHFGNKALGGWAIRYFVYSVLILIASTAITIQYYFNKFQSDLHCEKIIIGCFMLSQLVLFISISILTWKKYSIWEL